MGEVSMDGERKKGGGKREREREGKGERTEDPTPRGFATALIKTATTYGCIRATNSGFTRPPRYVAMYVMSQYRRYISLLRIYIIRIIVLSFLCISTRARARARSRRDFIPTLFFFFFFFSPAESTRKKRNGKYLRVQPPLYSNARHSSCIKANNLMHTCSRGLNRLLRYRPTLSSNLP